jgi:hypothetical protein
MTGQRFIIIFVGDVGFISPDNALTAEQLDIGYLGDTFKVGAYWVVTVSKYIQHEQRLVAHLEQSGIGVVDFSPEQLRFRNHLNEIKKVSFRTLDTSQVLKTIDTFAHKVTDSNTTNGSLLDDVRQQLLEDSKNKTSLLQSAIEPQKQLINIYETFEVRIKDLNFHNGKVSFDKFFQPVGKKLNIDIRNNFLKKEFDAVKNYFEHVLETKRITVTVNIQLEDGKVTSMEVTAPKIDLINADTIEKLRLDFVKDIIKKKQRIDSDKLLLTMEEFFDDISNEEWKAFYQSENELAEDLLKITNTKHYKNLRFLSDRHDSKSMKLCFIIDPFSFVLLISGQRQFHLVWETLDTEEATYIWHIDKQRQNLPAFLKQVEETIKSIKAQGKRNYINSSQDDYTRIYHNYSQDINGFLKWKDELEAIIG